jgi:N-acetylmuramoyl-L-alanine amidase
MNENILLYHLIIKLGAILGASLLIERILSFINVAINRMFIFQYTYQFTKAEKLKEQLKRDQQAIKESALISNETLVDSEVEEIPFHPDLPEEKKVNTSFELVLIRPIKELLNDQKRFLKYKENNTIRKEFWMQIFGMLIAIFVCRALGFSIWEFFSYSPVSGFPEPSTFGFIFTGVIIGAGSKPISFLMNFLLHRKIEIDKEEVTEEAKNSPDAEIKPSISHEIDKEQISKAVKKEAPSIEELVGFQYDGGDRPERLNNTHQYKKDVDIDLIVYHHTCMHSDAPFEEVVKEFDRKGWLTGYHCVVFKDGSIRVLCRWDRFGNHALGHNNHSFGLAFQGNFEPNPNIPSSNPDKKLGIMIPTSKQLHAAARVMALYAHMHNIPFVFPQTIKTGDPVKGIIPHYLIANKACPGGNFPHAAFKEYITNYYNAWKQDAEFKSALDLFKKNPLLMP